jgi:hypothetical protein
MCVPEWDPMCNERTLTASPREIASAGPISASGSPGKTVIPDSSGTDRSTIREVSTFWDRSNTKRASTHGGRTVKRVTFAGSGRPTLPPLRAACRSASSQISHGPANTRGLRELPSATLAGWASDTKGIHVRRHRCGGVRWLRSELHRVSKAPARSLFCQSVA